MKTNLLTWIAVIFMATATFAEAATNDLNRALQKGLFEEEANHNLEAAAQAYQTVATQFDKDRKVAATAIFRLGEVYRKQGKTNEANAQYERILRDFSDQTTLVDLSRNQVQRKESQLAGSKSTYQPSPEDAEIARIKAMIKDSPDLINALRPEYAPLHIAASKGQVAVAEFLLANGADVNRRSSANQTPLFLAAEAGHRAMVELLIANGADVNAKNPSKTALHEAAMEGFKAVAEVLLKNKADVNAKDNNGQTPLHAAATRGHKAVGEFLLSNGANMDARDEDGLTPLIFAVESRNLEMAKYLIANKADVNARTSEKLNGRAPLHFAVSAGNIPMVELLLKSGGEIEMKVTDNAPASMVIRSSTPLQMAVIRGQIEMTQLLLGQKANPNAVSDGERTPLHWAANKGHREIAELLLAHGARVDSKDEDGATPLFWAIRNWQKSMAEFLLTHKADPNIQNDEGHTLLGILKKRGALSSSSGVSNQELIELLKQYGANENAERLTHISTTRGGKENTAFLKGNQPLNRFTLIELIIGAGYHFPDLANVKIDRLEEDGKKSRIIPVNVEEILRSGDCAKNVWLEWGDVVEVPELDHRINESWFGYPKEYAETMQKCLERTVSIAVKGQTTNVTLRAKMQSTAQISAGKPQPNSWRVNWPNFNLGDVTRSHLRASSDRSRIQVKRSDPVTQQSHEIIVNLEKQDPDLWLLDGDAIEIPERDPNAPPAVPN